MNPKRIYRLYLEENLAVRRLKRPRIQPVPPGTPALTARNQEWAIDFMTDSMATVRSFRGFTVVDSYRRKCPVIEVATCLPSVRVARVLERIIGERGAPAAIRCDDRPELTSRHFLSWAEEHKVQLMFIAPGKPMQNGPIESLNGRFRDETQR